MVSAVGPVVSARPALWQQQWWLGKALALVDTLFRFTGQWPCPHFHEAKLVEGEIEAPKPQWDEVICDVILFHSTI